MNKTVLQEVRKFEDEEPCGSQLGPGQQHNSWKINEQNSITGIGST